MQINIPNNRIADLINAKPGTEITPTMIKQYLHLGPHRQHIEEAFKDSLLNEALKA